MALVGYANIRRRLDLQVFEVRRPAMIRPVTRFVQEPDRLSVPAHNAPPRDDDLIGHLTFALKHEGVNLQLLAAAMPHLRAEELAEAVTQTPNGQYLRMLCSIWEHFTGQLVMEEPPQIVGGYVDLFDMRRYFTGPGERDARWRVNFNGLGNWDYCVTVERTGEIMDLVNEDVLEAAREFLDSLDRELLDRTLNWAYLHETQDSYAIERETPSDDKRRTFIRLLKQAHEPRALTEEYLVELQNSIITNPYNQAVQYRTEQNWLSDGNHGALGVTFVPPKPDDIPSLMEGWANFANTISARLEPIMAASIASFGFVYIHPFMDGNGRLSRFLFHKLLCQSGRLTEGMLLPVSVAMKHHEAQYLQVLREFSRPARDLVRVRAAGEGEYDIQFKADDKIFRYWDATSCVEFGLRMAKEALQVELRNESNFILHYDVVYKDINDRFEMRGSTLATLVSIALTNDGVISRKKRKRYAEEVSEEAFLAIEESAKEALVADDHQADPDTGADVPAHIRG